MSAAARSELQLFASRSVLVPANMQLQGLPSTLDLPSGGKHASGKLSPLHVIRKYCHSKHAPISLWPYKSRLESSCHSSRAARRGHSALCMCRKISHRLLPSHSMRALLGIPWQQSALKGVRALRFLVRRQPQHSNGCNVRLCVPPGWTRGKQGKATSVMCPSSCRNKQQQVKYR